MTANNNAAPGNGGKFTVVRLAKAIGRFGTTGIRGIRWKTGKEFEKFQRRQKGLKTAGKEK